MQTAGGGKHDISSVGRPTATTRDAELRLTQETAGNGIVTTQSFDAQTGRLMDILAGTGNIVQNFSYTYDVLGNMLTRADANTNLSETFRTTTSIA
jgi:hypothetical protein